VWSLLLQEDFRKITVDRKGETNFFTSEMIKSCMKKVKAVNLHECIQVLKRDTVSFLLSVIQGG